MNWNTNFLSLELHTTWPNTFPRRQKGRKRNRTTLKELSKPVDILTGLLPRQQGNPLDTPLNKTNKQKKNIIRRFFFQTQHPGAFQTSLNSQTEVGSLQEQNTQTQNEQSMQFIAARNAQSKTSLKNPSQQSH
ncbi:hypothetical protein ILYODFUR_012311 [Ilyodon furcidens]|uniref:Uncharacterized protein n=1 Tax=Ilyodon furcidens TaxID=33524 RepID=A0ABV0U4T5_9TELE